MRLGNLSASKESSILQAKIFHKNGAWSNPSAKRVLLASLFRVVS
jgi:hypothetical protein